MPKFKPVASFRGVIFSQQHSRLQWTIGFGFLVNGMALITSNSWQREKRLLTALIVITFALTFTFPAFAQTVSIGYQGGPTNVGPAYYPLDYDYFPYDDPVDWIQVFSVNGDYPGPVYVDIVISTNYVADGVTQARSATLTLGTNYFLVTQDGVDNTYHFSPPTLTLTAEGGSTNVLITSAAITLEGSVVTANITSGGSWLALQGMAFNGTGENLFMTATANVTNNGLTQARTATIQINNELYTVTQAGTASATITVNANPTAGGTSTGSGTYAVGSQDQISATPAMFYTFAGWNDGNTANPRTITVPSWGASYTANFSPTPVITFYHQPGDDANGYGHAFLSTAWLNGDTQFYGFYFTNFADAILGSAPGIVAGNQPNWDFSISYPITVEQYFSVGALITQDKFFPPKYSLITFNCMNWVASIASAAGIQLPAYNDPNGIADPRAFAASLQMIGNGNVKYGGLVTESHSPDPATPSDYSYSGLENAGHTNAANLASSIGLAYDSLNLGMLNANTVNGLSLNLTGAATNQDVISMNWGDGSAFQEQSLTFSHVYSPGTYSGNLLVIDTGAVHSYDFTVLVSSAAAASANISVTQFSPVSIPNQGLVLSSPVPDFNVVQATSIAVLVNGQAVISFLGVSNWTYTIEAASDLTQGFLPIGTATAGSDGTFQYEDSAAVNLNRRFYRASYP